MSLEEDVETLKEIVGKEYCLKCKRKKYACKCE